MLILLSQANSAHRAHIVCGILNAHGVEAHVLHACAENLYAGAGTMTTSVWVHDEDLEDAREVLNSAPGELEALPEVSEPDPGGIGALPPLLAVATGMSLLMLVMSIFTGLLGILHQLLERGPGRAPEYILAFLLTLPQLMLFALITGLLAEVLCTVLLPIIRLYKRGSPLGVAVMMIIGVAVAVMMVLTA